MTGLDIALLLLLSISLGINALINKDIKKLKIKLYNREKEIKNIRDVNEDLRYYKDSNKEERVKLKKYYNDREEIFKNEIIKAKSNFSKLECKYNEDHLEYKNLYTDFQNLKKANKELIKDYLQIDENNKNLKISKKEIEERYGKSIILSQDALKNTLNLINDFSKKITLGINAYKEQLSVIDKEEL